MSKDYNYEIGYETLQSEWKLQCKRTLRGVTLVKGGNNIYLQFKTPNTTKSRYKCACTFSVTGMYEAVKKAFMVKEMLKTLDSEEQFWGWYKEAIEEEVVLVDDKIAFGEAIKKVEDDFWSRLSRTKTARSRNNPSDLNSWRETYGKFYKHLDFNEPFNLSHINGVIDKWEKGTKTYKYVVSAMKKLAVVNKKHKVYESLVDIDVTQTKFTKLQTVGLKKFLEWRDRTLGVTATLHKNCNVDTRKAWMWVFSMQIVYALRISEVFAIKNLFTDWVTDDKVTIPALIKPDNTENLIYIGDKTILGTKVKTGSRLARPNIPPKYPNLLEVLDIKKPLVPTGRPKTKKPETLVKFFGKEARTKLLRWNAPFTQTHADRHLGNINGIQAGIPLEVRAQSMGHTPAMNDGTYKKRQSTQTKIDLLTNSNTNAIDFITALAEAKKLVGEDELKREFTAQLLSIIYQKDIKAIDELL